MPGGWEGSGLGVAVGAGVGAPTTGGAGSGASEGGGSFPKEGPVPIGPPGRVGAKLQAVTPTIKRMLSIRKPPMVAPPSKCRTGIAFSLTGQQYSGINFPLKRDLNAELEGVPVRARSLRLIPLTLSILLALSPGVAARSLTQGAIGQEGAHVPEPGAPELSLGSRFIQLQTPSGIPSLGVRFGAWSGGSLGLSYSNSGAYLGNPHELEFSLKQRLLSEELGSPLSASFLGAVNTGAYSIDGELALSRDVGPLTLLSTARLLGNADGARMPLGGVGAGARLAVLPQVALVGDVFQVVNDATTRPAWGAGVQMLLPATPYAVTLHLSNTPTATRQGASLGTSDLRFGIDMGMAFAGRSSGRVSSPQVVRAPEPALPAAPAERPVTPMPARVAEVVSAPADARPAAVPEAKAEAVAPSAAMPPAAPVPQASAKPVNKPAAKPATGTTAKPAAKPAVKPAAKATPKAKPRTGPVAASKAPAGAVKPEAASKGPRESELWIVMIRDGRPTPAQVTLRRGSSVTWFNRDAVEHAFVAPGWDLGRLMPGAQVTRRFESVGTFRYQCRLHPNESGSITVR